MPLLAALLKSGIVSIYALVVAFQTLRYGVLLSVMGAASAAYVLCVIGWSLQIVPLIAALFSTAYGSFIGLAFPPIAGTVIAGYIATWSCVVAKNYILKITKLGLS